MPGPMKKAAEVIELVGVALTLFSIAAIAVEVFVPHQLTTSHKLLAWMAIGAILGAMWGYLHASFALLGQGRAACITASKKAFWIGLLVYVVLVIGPLLVVSPEFAERYAPVRQLREILLSPVLVLNVIEFIAAGFAAFCLARALVALSPRIADPKARIYKEKKD